MHEHEKRVILRTSASINYQLEGLDLYDSIRVTSLGEIFPHIVPGSEKEVIAEIERLSLKLYTTALVTANSEQAIDTANVVSRSLGIPSEIDETLNPLRFDLKKLMSREEFDQLGDDRFNELRRRYVLAFFEDKLIDPKESVIDRFNTLLTKSKREDAQVVLAISHAFLIKFFEVYSKFGERGLNNYSLLVEAWKPDKSPYGRFGGFEIGTGIKNYMSTK